MLRLPGARRAYVGRPAPVGPGNQRKIGILGANMASLQFAPYEDPSWELWAHASIVNKVPKGAMACFIDLHPPHCFKEARKNGFKDYYGWLQKQTTPIWMQETYPEIPAAMRFPFERFRTEWPSVPVASQTGFMIGLALMQGVTHLGFWGTHYAHESEYRAQRANTERWIGIAEGRGVTIVCPEENPLCHEPREYYAYETHNTVEKYEALKAIAAAAVNKVAFSQDRLVPVDTPGQELAALLLRREKDPEWAREMDKITNEAIPQGLLDMEARQRAKATAEQSAALIGQGAQ